MTWEILGKDDKIIDTLEDDDVTVLREGERLETVPVGIAVGQPPKHTARMERKITDPGDPLHVFLKERGVGGLVNRQAAVWSVTAPLQVGDTRIVLHHRKAAMKVRIEVTARRSVPPFFLIDVTEDVFGNLQHEAQ